MSAPVVEGDVLAGKYRVDKVLGVGGMGVVVAAHHLQLDEKVALKFLLPEVATDPVIVARFSREAQAAVKIKSEHVARVSDVGKLESGTPYMVMEYLEGGDLEALLEQRGTLPVEDVIEFVLQASEALAEAHALGIVHRDLKPANLFVIHRADGTPSIKVLDFGISKVTQPPGGGADVSLTKTAALMGSPLYMSPEQLQSAKDVDARTDIWAMGAVVYQLLTGRPPFDASTLPELFTNVLTRDPPSMRAGRADVPPELEAAVLRCLAKDREQRFANIAEMAAALYPFGPDRARISVERASRLLQGAGFSMSAPELPPASEPRRSNTASAWGNTAPGGRTRRRGAWVVVATAASLGGVGYVATRGQPDLAGPAATSGSAPDMAAAAPATAQSTGPTRPRANPPQGSARAPELEDARAAATTPSPDLARAPAEAVSSPSPAPRPAPAPNRRAAAAPAPAPRSAPLPARSAEPAGNPRANPPISPPANPAQGPIDSTLFTDRK